MIMIKELYIDWMSVIDIILLYIMLFCTSLACILHLQSILQVTAYLMMMVKEPYIAHSAHIRNVNMSVISILILLT